MRRSATGKFNLTGDGALVDLDGAPVDSFALDATAATTIVVTIERAGDMSSEQRSVSR